MLSGATYNVFLGRNFDALAHWLFKENKLRDFYCFQEFPEKSVSEIEKYLNKKDFSFVFTPGLAWKGKTYGELTIFNTNKLKLEESLTISLEGKGDFGILFYRQRFKIHLSVGRTGIDRTALLTQFAYQGKKFTIVNAHLTANHVNSRRIKQARMILGALEHDKKALILGDFNHPFGRGLPRVLKESGFTSAINKIKTFRFIRGIYLHLDYLFQRDCQVRNIVVESAKFSDHYPIFFEVEV
jgi:hypothetical protein